MLDRIKETGVYLIGTIGVAILSFIISLLYSSMFSPKDFGVYSLVSALYTLLFQLFTGWMTHSILRYYPEEKSKDNAVSLKNTILFLLIIVFILFSLIMMCVYLYYKANALFVQMCLTYIGVFFFEGLLLIFNTFLRAEGNSKLYSINTILNGVIKSTSILIIYYVIGYKNIVVIVLSLLISEMLQCFYMYFKQHWHTIISLKLLNKDVASHIISYGFPLIAVSMVFNILTFSDRFIIDIFATKADVGLYSYGYNMGNALFYTLTNAIMLGAYPRLTKEWVEKGRESTEKMMSGYLNLFCYLIIPASIGIIFVGERMIHCLCNERYWTSSTVFIITCLSYAVYGLAQYTNKPWELTKNTKMILRLNIISAIINIMLNIILIPHFGFVIASVTTLFSFLIYVIISLTLSRGLFLFKVNHKTLFYSLFSSFVMGLFIIVFNSFTRESLIILFIEVFIAIVLYVLILIILRDKYIIDTIKQLFRL